MHPNPAYRAPGRDRNLAFARDRGFGTLALNGPAGPLLSHVPVLIAPDGQSADLHLVRSNPIARAALPAPAVIAVSGPDGYVSPDWYGMADQVPTWNYVAVHLRGTLTALPESGMRDMLDRQSAAFEAGLAPKPAWTLDKMTAEARDRMMRQILPFRLHIEEVAGTWKLSQNKPDEVRLRASERLPEGMGSDLALLAGLMRDPPGA